MYYPITQLLHLFSLQYVAKTSSELNQRAIPKQTPVLPIVEERDNVERQVQRVPTIDSVAEDAVLQSDDLTQSEKSNVKPTAEDVVVHSNPVSSPILTANEIPHVQVETDNAREERLDKQWKHLKLDVADLPDIYARLSKIKLTGTVISLFFHLFTTIHACKIMKI